MDENLRGRPGEPTEPGAPDPPEPPGPSASVYYFRNYNSSDSEFADGTSYDTFQAPSVFGWGAPSGKLFKEWNDRTDGTGTSYQVGDAVPSGQSLGIYAIWQDDTRTFIVSGGELSTIAGAIRARTGDSSLLEYPNDFVSAISALPSFTLIGSGEYTVSSTSTTSAQVGTIDCSEDPYVANKIVYVRVRDKAGKRNGYYLGSDCFMLNNYYADQGQSTVWSYVLASCCYCDSSGQVLSTQNTYGLFPAQVSAYKQVMIYRRYNGVLGTLNGTFAVDVYLLDYPSGGSCFDI